MVISATTQPAPLKINSSSLWGKQIYISGLDTAHRYFSITPKDRCQDIWHLVQSMQKYISTINKVIIGRLNWNIFYINKSNKLTWKIINTQLSTSPQPSPIMWGKKVYTFCLDTYHRQLSITPKDNYQYQWMMIWSMQKNKSKINNGSIKTKISKENNLN